MPFTLSVQAKPIIGNKIIELKELLVNCGLKYGHDNEFYILEEGMPGKTAVFYNPKRIGRGIYFDATNMINGVYKISINIPTTESEINDFLNVVIELKRQMSFVSIYCVETKQKYTLKQLIADKDKIIHLSLMNLNNFCMDKEIKSHIFTLARWPFELTDDLVKTFAICNGLNYFEQLLHEKQSMDVYYAKPSFFKKKNGDIFLSYVLTDECESVFPINANAYFSAEKIKTCEELINFYIFKEEHMLPGAFDYNTFIQQIIDKGAKYYDNSHIIIPPMTKSQIIELTKKMKNFEE